MLVRKILETTLAAGDTSVTFTDSDIPNSLIRVYSTDPDLMPVEQSLTGTTLTITYEAQSSAKGIAVEMVKQGLEIVDNLISSDTDKALSAKQGKVLKDAIDGIVIPTVPESITDLDDVTFTDPTNGQVLKYQNGIIINADESGGGSYPNYSKTEEVLCNWINNTAIYKIVYEFDSALSVSYNSITNTSIDTTNMGLVIKAIGINADGTNYGTLLADPTRSSHTVLGLQANRNGANANIKYLILEYTKTS